MKILCGKRHLIHRGSFRTPYQPDALSAFFYWRNNLIIYKVTNKHNGKIYIGQTINKMIDRMGDHKRKSLKYGSKSHFHCAINKYGIEGFTWTVIDKAKTREELNKKEKYWVSFYNSIKRDKGYNLKEGGGQCVFTDEVKKKIGDAGRGRKQSKEHKELTRQRMLGSNNPFFGKKHSEETKIRISKSRKGKGLGQTKLQVLKCPHRGSNNKRSCIDEKIARDIKIMLKKGIRNCEIQKTLNISKGVIQGIKHEVTWKHVSV